MKTPFVTLTCQRSDECLNGLTIHGAVWSISLRPHENLIKPKRVLPDASVDAFIVAATEVLGSV